jgi:hypothetical protein
MDYVLSIKIWERFSETFLRHPEGFMPRNEGWIIEGCALRSFTNVPLKIFSEAFVVKSERVKSEREREREDSTIMSYELWMDER